MKYQESANVELKRELVDDVKKNNSLLLLLLIAALLSTA